MDYKGYAALEQVLTHTRDTVFKKQTLELEKLQRELDRLNNSHKSLIEYVGSEEKPPHYCQNCGSWYCVDSYGTFSFFKFYCKWEHGSGRVWVLEKVFLCEGCFFDICDIGSWPEGYLKLCTKYKFSHWCEGNDYYSVRQFIKDEDFGIDQFDGVKRLLTFDELQDKPKYEAEGGIHGKADWRKMHHIAAYIIQRAFRCGWDYRRAFDDPDEEEAGLLTKNARCNFLRALFEHYVFLNKGCLLGGKVVSVEF